jgi:N utilization substance protein B
MQYLYAAEISDFEDTKQHYKNLSNSIHSIHDLYLLNISLLIEIFKKAVNKYKISNESISGNISDIYSNEKFSKNQFLKQIFSNSKILELISSKDFINWDIDYKFVNLIYDKIIHSDIYSAYLGYEKKSFKIDLKFVQDIFKEIIVADEKFQSFVEEKNIYWMDDYPLVNTLLLKLFKSSTANSLEKLFYFKLFSNISDKKYFDELANLSLKNFESNNQLINKYITNWDLDRLAKIDLVIINLAITELVNFKEIPIKVSLNEYIEISKDYSTEKSSLFINGILDKIVKDLVKNNSLIKEGRGLRE